MFSFQLLLLFIYLPFFSTLSCFAYLDFSSSHFYSYLTSVHGLDNHTVPLSPFSVLYSHLVPLCHLGRQFVFLFSFLLTRTFSLCFVSSVFLWVFGRLQSRRRDDMIKLIFSCIRVLGRKCNGVVFLGLCSGFLGELHIKNSCRETRED